MEECSLEDVKGEARLREKLWEYITLCEDLERRMDVAHKTIEYLTERIIDTSGCLDSWQNSHQDRNPSPCKGELEGK